jgi:hypothetical protein
MVVHVVRRLAVISAVLALTLLTPGLSAQSSQDRDAPLPENADYRDWSDEVPAHISVVDGSATLERDGKVEHAEENLVLLAGDRLRTGRGRLEVLFDDGSALHLDENSTVDLMSESLIRLREGRLRLQVARTSRAVEYRIDSAPASAIIRSAGEYRVSLADARSSDPELRVVAMRGSAEVVNDEGRTQVRAGTEVFAAMGRAPSLPYAVNSAAWDAFERWAQRELDARLGVESVRYLPAEVRYYGGSFDHYGSWGYEGDYGGYVWYPRVAVGWRPYSYGRWTFVGRFGWTWVGYDRWSWATHHYGRWGVSAGRWYWVPDRRWAPAWVAWGYAPGYVSWCPLGYNGRAVFGFNYYGGYRDHWSAWTIVPARVFAPNIVVVNHVVRHEAIAPTVRSQFAEARRAPVGPTVVSRAEPLRAPPGPRAVPRNTMQSGAPASLRDGTSGTAAGNSGSSSNSGGFGTANRSTPSRQAAPRDRAIPPTPEVERVNPSRVRPPVVNTPWNGGQDSTSRDPGTSDPRAVSRSRTDDRPADPGRSDSGSRVLRSREPEPPAPSRSTPSRSAAPRWGGSEPRSNDPPEVRSAPPSRSGPSRPSEPPAREPSRSYAEPRGGGSDRPSAPPARSGGGESRSAPPPSAAPPRGGGGESRSAPPSAAPSRGGGGGESRPAPSRGGGQAQPRGRGGV